MQTLQFTKSIHAPKELVWNTMLEKTTYEQRTSAFCEGSTYEGSRDQGSKIKFHDPEGNGMLSEIAESTLYTYVSIKHLGEFTTHDQTGTVKEIMYPEAMYENYSFDEKEGVTTVTVVMTGLPEEYVEAFQEMRPLALRKLKKICES